MKKIFILSLMFVSLLSLRAQTDFARAFPPTCGQAGNVSYSFGQPFFQQLRSATGAEVSEGVQQAQILYSNIVQDGCQNAPDMMLPTFADNTGFFRGYDNAMTFNGAILHVLPAGHYDSTDVDSRHYSWTSQFNYDSVTTLLLDVWPIYEVNDTLRLYVDDMRGFEPGGGPENDRTLPSIHSCDSLVHYYVLTCGEEVADADNNPYSTLFVGPYCWTQQNLYPTHYTGGAPIPNSMIYYSVEHPDSAANLAQYGRLYTWYSAVGLPENSSSAPAADANGFVQGICPIGWHIPTERNMESLTDFGAPALKSTILWLQPGNNSTGFTAYPAGLFNPNTNRFENMLGETRYWTESAPTTAVAVNGAITNGCEELLLDSQLKNYGFSVRCVKNNVQ